MRIVLLWSLCLSIIINFPAFARNGGGAGGGGLNLESLFMKTAWNTLNRLRKLKFDDPQIAEVVNAVIHQMQTAPPIVKEVTQLSPCSNKEEDKIPNEVKNAWGCPPADGRRGTIQLKHDFNWLDEALVFHELTRSTANYDHADDGMLISIGKLKLNLGPGSFHAVLTVIVMPKRKFSFDEAESQANLAREANGYVGKIVETRTTWKVPIVWPVLGQEIKGSEIRW
jgi:hypothetical protein